MALKSTIFKAMLKIADMDRGVYVDRSLTIARHPSETDERMLMRVFAYALHTPASEDDGALQLAKGLSDGDEPDLWQKDLTGAIQQWIEVGQPDDRRLLKACGRAAAVKVYAYGASTPIWWSGIAGKLLRARGLEVWQVAPAESQALAELAARGMQLQFTIQDGSTWVSDQQRTVELSPRRLFPS